MSGIRREILAELASKGKTNSLKEVQAAFSNKNQLVECGCSTFNPMQKGGDNDKYTGKNA